MNSYEVEQMQEGQIKDMLGWATENIDDKILCAVMALCTKVGELRERMDSLEYSPTRKKIMSIQRCENCGRRMDRPAHPSCTSEANHVEPTTSQIIVGKLEADLTSRRGFQQVFEQIDPDTQDEIRDKWAEIIEQHIVGPCFCATS